jgi:hyperosmotically inducible protein
MSEVAVSACPMGLVPGDTLRRLGLGLAILTLVIAAGGCRTAGDPYTDARIEAEIKARLVGEHDANLTRLAVVSSDGTVYLSGVVPSPEQKARAETVAKGVTGVRKVVNALDVRPAPE